MNMNFGQALILARPESSSCLHIFDGTRPDFTDADDFATLSTAKYSDINLIDTLAAPAFPPVALLGAEPTHGWCYYFEKASLARQRMDWQEIVRLGNEAASLGLRPDDYSEWIPFILGFAFTGDFASVDSLVPILKENLRAKDSVCTNLEAQAKGVGEVSGEDPGITAGREYILKHFAGIDLGKRLQGHTAVRLRTIKHTKEMPGCPGILYCYFNLILLVDGCSFSFTFPEGSAFLAVSLPRSACGCVFL